MQIPKTLALAAMAFLVTDANGNSVSVYVDAAFQYVSTESGRTRP